MADKQKTLQRVSQALALLAAASSGPLLSLEPSVNPGEVATELEPITVTPQFNPLDASINRLCQLLEDPNHTGCGFLIEADRENVYLKIGKALSAFTGADFAPPNPDYVQRQEYRVRNDWRHAERGPDMDDFR